MKIALVGLGNWGLRLIPKLFAHPGVEKLYGYDIDESKNSHVSGEFPELTIVSDYDMILQNAEISAVVVATPAASHYMLARLALESQKHVLVEKPLTNSVADAEQLVELARHRELTLMVDHITVYGGAVRALKRIVDADELGELLYFDSVRANLGMLQSDVNVIWDLGIHEFAVLDYLIGELPVAVSGVGFSRYGKQEEIAYVTLYFNNDLVAHVHVSWVSPIKIRRLIAGGRKKMIVFDDARAKGKLEVFDSGIDVSAGKRTERPIISYRRTAPRVLEYDESEPLALMVDTFVASINARSAPLTSGESGLRMVRVLAAVEKSLKHKGSIVPLD
ncbi:MAG: Gfo/Idh/MocA family oxidoreductase [candidate division WOR-3 bacterium]|nr:MAG: Gfo/Idh/MocA family oxidoreductase [candidate division WOR-3 bacterium]